MLSNDYYFVSDNLKIKRCDTGQTFNKFQKQNQTIQVSNRNIKISIDSI